MVGRGSLELQQDIQAICKNQQVHTIKKTMQFVMSTHGCVETSIGYSEQGFF